MMKKLKIENRGRGKTERKKKKEIESENDWDDTVIRGDHTLLTLKAYRKSFQML